MAEKLTHDTWFRAKVREALADTRPDMPHQQVMDEVQALIDRKMTGGCIAAGRGGTR